MHKINICNIKWCRENVAVDFIAAVASDAQFFLAERAKIVLNFLFALHVFVF